ncbi:hypothetical protein, partial [Leptospira santarosai]|uniref:hypothetical protein n=1 Tax=Leptospira santarosai TaxID=28183 RepID=UPI001F380630
MKEKQSFTSGNIQYRSVSNLNRSITLARGYLLFPHSPGVSAGVVFRKKVQRSGGFLSLEAPRLERNAVK